MSSTVGCIVTVLLLDVTLGANDASFNEWATFLEQGDLEKQHVQYRISDINSSLDYFNAQSYCEAVGGYLAEPKTEDEIKILRVIIQEAGPRNNWWIGIVSMSSRLIFDRKSCDEFFRCPTEPRPYTLLCVG